ncbi:MAG TPA: hypothetical protein RMH99_02695 [Sandaracinaceae bacterium LLY-WYZ-13_1]|nr:hypothetical protein [Sandaracinaceae bacterium LLY-WYZ-13_1]
MKSDGIEGEGGVLPRALSERVREHSDSVLPLVLEAFREGRRAGVERLAEDLLGSVTERLAAVERQYEELGAEQMEVIAEAHEGHGRPAAVDAWFGATGAVLTALRGEIRSARPGPDERTREG